MNTIDLDGYALACVERGAGPPVLLIHGSLADYRAWTHQIEDFGSRFRVLAPSLRHGYPERWDGKGGDFTIEQHARDLARLLKLRASSSRACVVGHSRGGAVAIELARTRPDLVHGLVLADPGGLEGLLPPTREGRAMADESSAMFRRLAQTLARGDAVEAARDFVDALGGPGTWDRRDAQQRQWLLDNLATGPHCGQRPAFPAADLRNLAGPLLLVTGARSPRRYRIMLEALRTLRGDDTRITVIPDAAHAMNRENPVAFNDAVLVFLRGVTHGAAR